MAPGNGFRRVLAAALAGWLLEAAHYTLLVERYGVGAPAPALERYLWVTLAGLLPATTRLLFFMAAFWVSAWLFGLKLDGRSCLEAATYGSLALGAVALLLTPLAPLGAEGFTAYVNVVYAAELAAQAWGMAVAALDSLPARTRPLLARLAAASALAVLLVGLTPAALLTPQAQVYSVIHGVLSGNTPGTRG